MATWHNFPDEIPADGSTVWVRTIAESPVPFQARITYSTARFTEVAHGVIYPVYMISAWRDL